MPYLGNTAGNRFVASKAATQFSGDGSTTAFTLDHAVGSDEDILVSVDGVIQEPSVAYAVSNGTTLTFTAAPSSNSGNNIFVYYLFRTVATVDHPSTSALSATSGTFSTTIASTGNATVGGTLDVTGNVGLGGANTSSYLQGVVGGKTATIGDGSQASSTLVLKDDDGVFDIATTGGTFRIYDDNTERMRIDANGHITKPTQSAFNVQMSTNSAQSGSGIQPSFGTEHFDQNADFSGTTFTAPVTGKYYLSTIVYGYYLDNGASYYYLALTTSNRQYVKYLYTSAFDEDMIYYGWGIDVLADMDASDTATVFLGQVNGHSITQLLASNTFFSGALIC